MRRLLFQSKKKNMPRKIRTVDVLLYIIPLLLLSVSVSLIYSLVFSSEDSGLALKQLMVGGVGIVGMMIFSFIDYRSLKNLWWVFYIIAVVLLLIVDVIGKVDGGAMRWIDLGFFQLQPSEIAKFALIISFSAFFSSRVGRLGIKDYLFSLLIFIPPLGLILKEPDLGTAIVAFIIFLGTVFAAKPSRIQKSVIVSSMAVVFAVFVLSAMNVKPFGAILHQYQRERILTFIDPNRDPYGQGYNVRQAQIAIGSGGLFGKGLGRGSQSQLEFLPKPHTDFIFAGASEAFGFAGSSLLIALLLVLVIRIYSIGQISQDSFGVLLAAGAAAMFLGQSVINIGMNLGLAPVTGIPLPFVSSGGTALVIYLAIIGIIQSIYIRHKKLTFA